MPAGNKSRIQYLAASREARRGSIFASFRFVLLRREARGGSIYYNFLDVWFAGRPRGGSLEHVRFALRAIGTS